MTEEGGGTEDAVAGGAGKPARVAWLLLALLSAFLSLRIDAPPALIAAPLAIVLCYLPGALLAPRIVPSWSPAGRFLSALVLSPFLAGGLGALLMALGLGTGAAARVLLLLLAPLAAAAALRSPRTTRPARDEGLIWAGSLVWTGLILLILIGNRNLIPRSDGWFHAAVALQISARGVPPEDPFFAGLRLLYFWGSHAWAALWLALAPRLSVWIPLVALNLSGAIAAMIGVGLLARRLGAKRAGIGMALLLAAFGYAPFAWGWIAARAASGSVRGLAEVQRLVGQGIAPTLSSMGTGMLHLSMVFFGGKFLVLTPFGLGLGIFLAFVLAALDLLEHAGPRQGAALALFLACALFIHTFVGLCCLALAGGWGVWLLTDRLRGRRVLRPRHRGGAAEDVRAVNPADPAAARRSIFPALLLAVAVGLLLVSPYLVSILAGKRGQLASGLSLQALVTWLWGGALVVPVGMIRLWRTRSSAASRLIALFAVLLTVAALCVDPSDNNQSKFFNLLFLVLACPAGQGWIDLLAGRRPWVRTLSVAALIAATAPTAALSTWAYIREPGLRAERGEAPTPRVSEALEWARTNTAPDAVLVEEDGGRDGSVLAARSDLWGGDAWGKKWGYPVDALAIRQKSARELLAGGNLSPDVEAFLADLGRPVVVVRRAEGVAGAAPEASHDPSGRPLYRNEAVVLILHLPAR